MELITEKYKKKIAGQLGCLDRVIIKGTLPRICYADGMATFMRYKKIRIFDYAKFSEPFTERTKQNAKKLAASHGVEIIYVNKQSADKDVMAKSVLQKLQKQKC